MSGVEIYEVFDRAFGEVTKKLVSIDLKKVKEDAGGEETGFLEQGYRESIRTKGYINAKIVCHFSDGLFQYITDTMNGGVTPSDEEVPLYLNEYVNITCGYALSKLNNIVEKPSRLSVPSFYQMKEPLDSMLNLDKVKFLSYDSKVGRLHVYICYSVENDYEEGKE